MFYFRSSSSLLSVVFFFNLNKKAIICMRSNFVSVWWVLLFICAFDKRTSESVTLTFLNKKSCNKFSNDMDYIWITTYIGYILDWMLVHRNPVIKLNQCNRRCVGLWEHTHYSLCVPGHRFVGGGILKNQFDCFKQKHHQRCGFFDDQLTRTPDLRWCFQLVVDLICMSHGKCVKI